MQKCHWERSYLASNPDSPFRILSLSFGEKSGMESLGSRLGVTRHTINEWALLRSLGNPLISDQQEAHDGLNLLHAFYLHRFPFFYLDILSDSWQTNRHKQWYWISNNEFHAEMSLREELSDILAGPEPAILDWYGHCSVKKLGVAIPEDWPFWKK